VLHPYLGISWFRKLDESGERANQALIIFGHAFKSYSEHEKPVEMVPTTSTTTTNSSLSFLDSISLSDIPEPTAASNSQSLSELDRFYLVTKPVGGDPNEPLAWWKIHASEYPTVARMARDFLAIPGTSVSVERLFSKSRHLCSDLRSSLLAPTIMRAMLSKCWIKDGLFDPHANLAGSSAQKTSSW